MKQLSYSIRQDESINRWWITDVKRKPFNSPYETFEAEVNLGEAYVQIVYPVRKSFLEHNNIADVPLYKGNYDRIYFPFENNRVDFTTFIHTPHHIWINAKCFLQVDETGLYPFEIYTCGGMKIWVNQQEVTTFTPYNRNIPEKCNINLPLHKGLNEIVVYADELAERDVFFYYEFRYKGTKSLIGILPVEENSDEIVNTENFLKSCYFEKDYFEQGQLILQYDQSLLKGDKELYITGNFLNNSSHIKELIITASKDASHVLLGDLADFNIGVFEIFISSRVGNETISRNLVAGIIPNTFVDFNPAPTLQERKRQALEFISEHGETSIHKTLAILETKHTLTSTARLCLETSLEKIRSKADCADFDFPAVLQLITYYKQYLTDEDYETIKKVVLDFRFWIDEPGNDVMWYFSENHALLFHISQYLSGHLFPNETFTVSERTGKEQYAIGKKRLEDWFKIFFQYGYAEWNSATYIPIDLIGFFTLHEMSPDQSLRDIAKSAIDFTFKIMAYNMFNGVMSSSYGRAYENTLKAREQVEPSFLNWVSYGVGFVHSRAKATAMYCLSDYVPPSYDEETKLSDGEWMSVELDQGINQVKTFSFRTTDYFMGSVRRFKPFVHGHQQHLMNIALGRKSVQFYINHPGEKPFSGGNRPSYWAGNGTIPYIEQYKNLIVMLYKIEPTELVHSIHAYATLYSYDDYEITNHWFFAKVDDSYVGAYFSNGLELTTYGANTNKEIISQGLNHGVIIKCGSKREFGDFTSFKESLKSVAINYDGNNFIEFADPQYGLFSIKDLQDVYINNILLDYLPKPNIEVLKGILQNL